MRRAVVVSLMAVVSLAARVAAGEEATSPPAAESGPEVPQAEAPPQAAAEPAPPAAPEPPGELARRIEVLAAELEKLRLGDVVPEAEGSAHGLGPAASKVYRTQQGVTLGGYGELLYRNFVSEEKQDVFDFQRAVLYVGYKFNDKFVLNTEIEVEHAKEIFVEFAYVDWLFLPELSVRGGMVLLPVGLLNELHEPTVFLGALRPEVEQRLIPSTWRENGLGVFGELGPFSYRAFLVNGLKGSGFTAQGLRGGRQKGAEALTGDYAGVARVDFTGVPGLLVGGSAYYGGAGQQLKADVSTFLCEGHLDFKWRGLEVRGLFAWAEVGNVDALNQELKLSGAKSVGEAMRGWYAQVGFDVFTLLPARQMSLTPFVRWEALNTQVRVPDGYAADPANDNRILTAGAQFQPIPWVVVKGEFQRRFSREGVAANQVNAMVGYVF